MLKRAENKDYWHDGMTAAAASEIMEDVIDHDRRRCRDGNLSESFRQITLSASLLQNSARFYCSMRSILIVMHDLVSLFRKLL